MPVQDVRAARARSGPMPDEVAAELARVRAGLDATVPAKWVDRNLLVATWNLRAFGDLTLSWQAGPRDSPKRDLRALHVIAEVVSRFDVMAVQEVKGNISALRHLLDVLGPSWGLILTDVTQGPAGNGERLAFVFDTRRVQPSGLAGELVVPLDRPVRPGAFDRQFARTPYAVSFRAGAQTFLLVTLHVLWGQRAEDRTGELRAIADWLADWARQVDDWNENLIALGDFNIDRRGDPRYRAFTSTGLRPPDALNEVPRTLSDRPGEEHFYDQIAWFPDGAGVPALSLDFTGRAGTFDFRSVAYPGMSDVDLSWRISDHFPLWVEFGTSA